MITTRRDRERHRQVRRSQLTDPVSAAMGREVAGTIELVAMVYDAGIDCSSMPMRITFEAIQ